MRWNQVSNRTVFTTCCIILKKRTEGGTGQVIMTTHSPVAVEALRASDLSVARYKDSITEVRQVPSDLDDVQGAMRAGPSSVLARAVIVCEGKTEMGVCRRMLQHWDMMRAKEIKPLHTTLGVSLSNGQGSTNAPQRARILQELGYPTLLVIDNDDRTSDKGVTAATVVGTQIVRWQNGHALEDEIVDALSPEGIVDFMELAAQIQR
jgi:putative ATP-dependent endonuclease of the OLD family